MPASTSRHGAATPNVAMAMTSARQAREPRPRPLTVPHVVSRSRRTIHRLVVTRVLCVLVVLLLMASKRSADDATTDGVALASDPASATSVVAAATVSQRS